MEILRKRHRAWNTIYNCSQSRNFRKQLVCCLRLDFRSRRTISEIHSQGSHPPLIIGRNTYTSDDWTNVTPRVHSLVGVNLHLRTHHPLWRLKRRIVDHFYKNFPNPRGNPLFSIHEDFNPVVTLRQNFDSLLVPADHPSRSRSDTYYVNREHVLRAHTSAHQWDLINSGLNNFLVIGDVYRRDAIDSSHYPVFHQMEGVRLSNIHELTKKFPGSKFQIFDIEGKRTDTRQAVHTAEGVAAMETEMKSTIEVMCHRLFGDDTEGRWVDAYFPFTHPSWEYEIRHDGNWMEVLGCGIMEHEILKSAGVHDKMGWAFGFGLERLAMKLYNIPDIRLFWSQDTGFLSQFEVDDIDAKIHYKPISVCPQCINDISFWIPDDFATNDFLDLVRNVGGNLIEQVSLVDTFYHPKKKLHSHCYRIIYRHMERTLTQEEVNSVHNQIAEAATNSLHVSIR